MVGAVFKTHVTEHVTEGAMFEAQEAGGERVEAHVARRGVVVRQAKKRSFTQLSTEYYTQTVRTKHFGGKIFSIR